MWKKTARNFTQASAFETVLTASESSESGEEAWKEHISLILVLEVRVKLQGTELIV